MIIERDKRWIEKKQTERENAYAHIHSFIYDDGHIVYFYTGSQYA